MSQDRSSKKETADVEEEAAHHAVSAANDATGPAGDAAVKRIAHHGAGDIEDLGRVDKPGAVLAGKTKTLKPGASLRFECGENQIFGVQGVTATKPVTVATKNVKSMTPGQLGDQNVHQFTLTMAADAKPGDHATVTTTSGYQSRNDKDYAFTFKIVCG